MNSQARAPHKLKNHRQALSRILILRAIALSIAIVIILIFEFQLERPLLSFNFILALLSGFALVVSTRIRLMRKTRVSMAELSAHLLADAILLVTLVSLSGGSTNPFIYYYLVLIAVSSAALPQIAAWFYCGLATIIYSLMMYFDLSAHAHHGFSDFQLHLVGMWLNFVGSSILLCLFVSRFSNALLDTESSLAKIREENLRNEQLIGIGTLATSTAHRLGTPLTSIAILLSELDLSSSKKDIREDLNLALSQVDRAKNTLKNLQQLAEPDTIKGKACSLHDIMLEFKEHFQLSNSRLIPHFDIPEKWQKTELQIDIFLLHALINLIENAVRAAKERVVVSFEVENNIVRIVIEDDGDGFTDEQLDRWGQPLNQSNGLGMGLFLANHTIEKMGGEVFASRTHTQTTKVTTELPIIMLGKTSQKNNHERRA